MTTFASLNLSKPLNIALNRLGYTTPTPIQMQAIPEVMAGKDIMGIAQTGTGKTAAFALPTLDYLVREDRPVPKRGARVLVLAPTRELASQIAVSFRDYGNSIDGFNVAVVFGGVPIARQIKKLVGGNDVLVATPGRLIDLLDRKDIRLSDAEVLILDEADQMMDMGFIHALRKIVPQLPKQRQTLFFSATMSPQIKKLSQQFLTDPVRISVAPANTTAEKVTQSLIFVSQKEKQDLLGLTLLGEDIDRALVFTRTKHGADRVVKRLAKVGLEALAIHGNKSQNQRQRALAAFREGRIKYLIATDVAARGIDIEGISHVINFEIPNVPEQYVHRIGRTARANKEGLAIAFVAPDEKAYLKDIQKLLKQTIPVEKLPEDFIKKSKALNSRPALPKPDRPDGQGKPGPKRPKRRKKPKSAIELLNEDISKQDGEKKQNHRSHKKRRGGKPKSSNAGEQRQEQGHGGSGVLRGGQPRGDGRSHAGAKSRPQSRSQSGGLNKNRRRGGKSGGRKPGGAPRG